MPGSVLCTLLVTVVVILNIGLAGAQGGGFTSTVTTNGISGEECGPRGSRCRADFFSSTCNNDTGSCECDYPEEDGKGNFMCHCPEEEFCAVLNDPEICQYDGTRVNIPLSCKTILTAIETPICIAEGDKNVTTAPEIGTCFIDIYIWGTQVVGRAKLYIGGLEFRVVLAYLDGRPTIYQNYRVYGTAENGVYEYTFDGNQNPGPGGPWATGGNLISTPEGGIYEVVDDVNNFASIYADLCGVKAGIRVVDRTNPFEQVPGVYVKVLNLCDPVFTDTEKTELCGFPAGQGPTVTDLVDRIFQATGNRLSPSQAQLFGVLRNGIDQEFPGADPGLQDAIEEAAKCDDAALSCAARDCLNFLNVPFQRCFQGFEEVEDGVIVEISAERQFADCVAAYCQRLASGCRLVHGRVVESQCAGVLASPNILEHSCDEPPPC